MGLIKSGSDDYRAKLTSEQVKFIRKNYIPRHPEFGGAALARKYGVNQQTISRVVNYKRYKNVE